MVFPLSVRMEFVAWRTAKTRDQRRLLELMSQSSSPVSLGSFSLNGRPWVWIGALALLICFAFFNGIENLFKRWGEQQELSHGYFLPFVTAWMLWERRDALTGSLSRPDALGLAGVLISAIILLLSEMTVTSLMIFQQLALILLFASLSLALGGRSFLKLAIIPIAFLLFMIPPPYWVITVLSWKFQFWSSQLGVWMIEGFGIPVFLSGNIIDLGDYQLAVAEACSGLRYLFPFLSLGFLAAYLFKAPLWQRAIVFLSTIPITIFMNSLRIALTGVLVQAYGTSHAEGLLHFFEGWVVFVFCMVLLFAVIAAIARFSGRKDLGDLLSPPEIEKISSAGGWTEPSFQRNAAIAAAIIAAAGVTVHLTGNDNLRVPVRADLDGIVTEFDGWTHEKRRVDDATLEALGADDYIIADMGAPNGDNFNLYIAYLNMQRDGHSWHSPRQCIPGGGWKILSHDILPTNLSNAEPFKYNRIVIENRGYRQLVYYWYDQRSRKIANEFTMKFALLFDAVKLRRTDGAMIRIMTPVGRTEDIKDADARLTGFMDQLQPKLPAYVPPADLPDTAFVSMGADDG